MLEKAIVTSSVESQVIYEDIVENNEALQLVELIAGAAKDDNIKERSFKDDEIEVKGRRVKKAKPQKLDDTLSNQLVNEGSKLLTSGKMESAIDKFQHAISKDPTNYRAHGNLGTTLYLLKKHSQALVSIQKAKSLNPSFAPIHNAEGMIYEGLGETSNAIGSYQNCVKLDKEHASAHMRLGINLIGEGNGEEAIKHLEKAMELGEDSEEAIILAKSMVT